MMKQFEERNKVRTDLLSGRKPSRVLVNSTFTIDAACGYAGINLAEAHYNMELIEKAFEKTCEDFYADIFPVETSRFPLVYQILGAKNFIMGSGGTVQHPEIETMHIDEYDEFIDAPYKTILEKFLPRVCTALDTDPVNQGLVLAKAFSAYGATWASLAEIYAKLSEKHGYCQGFFTGPINQAPFDFLADQLRGFKNITMDIRRIPDKVEKAVKAITPLMLKMSIPTVRYPGIINMIFLHMAPFINQEQFERFYWPSLKEVVTKLDQEGISNYIWVEQDETRYAEYFASLPESTIFFMENGDPKHFTKTVGKNHAFGGFYDPLITLSRSKEDCIDEAKRLLDICMKSDHFYFTFNRQIMDIKSVDVPKIQAVLEWVRNNGKY
jgi:hypothetical protein